MCGRSANDAVLRDVAASLQERFGRLAAERKQLGNPVYALEHGLTVSEIEAVRIAASIEYRNFGIVQGHWLVWLALAAEAGYSYNGEEFWPEFSADRAQWRSGSDRTWLRRRHELFRDRYGGPHPTGDWAGHFNIIAWPIANAVLPRFLQAYFAEHLFAERYSLARSVAMDPDALGTVLLASYRGSSSRYRLFLQQTDLTGRLILALRDLDHGHASTRLCPELLARVIGDLERRRDSRDFLRDARRVIGSRQTFLAPALRAPATTPSRPASAAARPGVVTFAVRVSGEDAILGVILPDVGVLLDGIGAGREMLSRLRIRFVGSSAVEPAAVLLTFAGRDRRLEAYPGPGEPIATLEGVEATRFGPLQSALVPQVSAIRLLKRGSDGLFREVVGRQARSGGSYLLLPSSDITKADVAALRVVRLRSSVVAAAVWLLELDPVVAQPQEDALRRLGVGLLRGVRIEPLGLSPASGPAGIPMWLTTEPIVLRLSADHPVWGFAIRMDGVTPVMIRADTEGSGIDVLLDDIAPGPHAITVQTARTADPSSAAGPVAEFEFDVREPAAWQESMRRRSGIRLATEPPGADMEAVLGNRASVVVVGPPGRRARWTLCTFDAESGRTASRDGGTTRIGGDPREIARVLDGLRNALSDEIDLAHRVQIAVVVEELGRQSLMFEHRVEPLRWSFDPRSGRARLIDETDRSSAPALCCYDLARPAAALRLDHDRAIDGFDVPAPGRLLVARHEGALRAMFASRPTDRVLHSLSELDTPQAFDFDGEPAMAMLILLQAMGRWKRAKALGPQAIFRKQRTLEALRHAFRVSACGSPYAQALRAGPPFSRVLPLVGGDPEFGARILGYAGRTLDQATLSAFASLAVALKFAHDPEDARHALRIAASPLSYRIGKTETELARMRRTLSNLPMVRGAFLAGAIMGDESVPSGSAS